MIANFVVLSLSIANFVVDLFTIGNPRGVVNLFYDREFRGPFALDHEFRGRFSWSIANFVVANFVVGGLQYSESVGTKVRVLQPKLAT